MTLSGGCHKITDEGAAATNVLWHVAANTFTNQSDGGILARTNRQFKEGSTSCTALQEVNGPDTVKTPTDVEKPTRRWSALLHGFSVLFRGLRLSTTRTHALDSKIHTAHVQCPHIDQHQNSCLRETRYQDYPASP